MFLGACTTNKPQPLEGLPDSVFQVEEEYKGRLETLGDLTDGYLVNTTALRRANNKINTLCVAALRCTKKDN